MAIFGSFVVFSTSLFSTEHVYLKTPNISKENIIGTNVGIRPYRKSGVRLEAEFLKDKCIIHNYGYGGSGITLCFGGSQEVIEMLNHHKPSSKVVAVLGAGVVGLATAYDLLEQGYDVHIYSNDWSPNLTSNVAAGIWSPLSLSEDVSEEKKQLHQRMLDNSEQRFLKSTNDYPEFAGIRLISSYSVRTNSAQEAIKTKHRGEEVVLHFDNGVIKSGRRVYELGIDGKLFMEDLYSKVQDKGAILQQRHFDNLNDLLNLQESIIVNCTSIGSRELFNDQEFVPVRGQLVYFKPQEGIDFLFYQNIPGSSTSWVSIYPWSDRIILGGVYERDNEDAHVTPEVIDTIIQNAQKSLSGNF